MGDILDKIGEYMNKKVKYGIAGACLMLIIFIVYMICTYNPTDIINHMKKKTMLSQWK